jgi:hypothetical protein
MLVSMDGILPGQLREMICDWYVCCLRVMTHVPLVTENSSLCDMVQTGSKHMAGQLQKFYEKIEMK